MSNATHAPASGTQAVTGPRGSGIVSAFLALWSASSPARSRRFSCACRRIGPVATAAVRMIGQLPLFLVMILAQPALRREPRRRHHPARSGTARRQRRVFRRRPHRLVLGGDGHLRRRRHLPRQPDADLRRHRLGCCSANASAATSRPRALTAIAGSIVMMSRAGPPLPARRIISLGRCRGHPGGGVLPVMCCRSPSSAQCLDHRHHDRQRHRRGGGAVGHRPDHRAVFFPHTTHGCWPSPA